MKDYLTLATLAVTMSLGAANANADDINIGLVGGITGGAAAFAPEMLNAQRFALKQINDQGGILDGKKIVGIVADDGCTPQQGVDAATKLVNVSHIQGMVGPFCSGALLAVANSVTIPAGLTVISSGATSPELTKLKDNDTVFRTVPSDLLQGAAVAHALLEKGIKQAAVSYVNVDYGRGLADAFKRSYEADGGKITGYAAHEENKPSYRSDIAELAKGGAETLVIFDYGDSSGLTVLREAIEDGSFKSYYGAESMRSATILKTIGAENLEGFTAIVPIGEKSESLDVFRKSFKEFGGDPTAVLTDASYDAAFLMALAIEKAKGDKEKIPESLRAVASGPGEPIRPGEWKKAKELIDAGKPIDYKGAAGDLNFDAGGDVSGLFGTFQAEEDGWKQVGEIR
ncbi:MULTISPECIES: ABC transporter substrate-binding protein [Rhizobium]|nr:MULTISPECIES: ABC transporter substrate-binding protein [Rhizobium]